MSDILEFHAERVASSEIEYTSSFVVSGIYFERGDPEANGHSWNWTTSTEKTEPGDPLHGVCTVKEIQQIVLYGGIAQFELRRDRLDCEFDGDGQRETGLSLLAITFQISDVEWNQLRAMSQKVFDGETYFKIVDM